MTGRGHRWTSVGAAFFAASFAHWAHLPPVVAGAVAAASVTLPDWAEVPFYKNGQRAGSLIAHRTITHWPMLWLAVVYWGLHEGGLIGAAMIGTAFGSFAHIIGDAPNPMGIPWLLPNRRLRIGTKGLWKSGEFEPFIALIFAVAGFATWRIVS